MRDIAKLEDFLSSDEKPKDCMTLSQLDGFLHGIACSPIFISAAEWFPTALAGPGESFPDKVIERILKMTPKFLGT